MRNKTWLLSILTVRKSGRKVTQQTKYQTLNFAFELHVKINDILRHRFSNVVIQHTIVDTQLPTHAHKDMILCAFYCNVQISRVYIKARPFKGFV